MRYLPHIELKSTKYDWMKKIPEDWDVMNLSHAVRMKSGESITSLEISPDGAYPVYGGNGVRGYFDFYTHNGDYVLIGRQGALCGNIKLASGKFWASEHAVVVMPDRDLNTTWLSYLLTIMDLNQYSVAAAQPGLSVETIERLKIPFPKISEQKKIATFLNYKTQQIDQLIEKKKALIEKLNEQRIAVITQAVTKGLDKKAKMKPSGVDWLGDVPEHWEVMRLRFCIISNPVKSEIKGLEEDLVSFVPMEAVKEYGGMDLSQTKMLEDVYNGYTYFKENDVVVAKITPCFENGKGSLARGLKNGIGFGSTELHVLRGLGSIDEEYLFYLTISYSFRKNGEAVMLGAGGHKRIPEDYVKDYRQGMPDKDEQKEIVKHINKRLTHIDDMVYVSKKTIEKYEEYRTSIITAAVTGKIDVRNVGIGEVA